VDGRLVVDLEPALRRGEAQVAVQGEAGACRLVGAALVEADLATPLLAGAGEGTPHRLEQVRTVAVHGPPGDADGRVESEVEVLDPERLLDAPLDLLGEAAQARVEREARPLAADHDEELVDPDAAHLDVAVDEVAQPVGDESQDLVADARAERLV